MQGKPIPSRSYTYSILLEVISVVNSVEAAKQHVSVL
jgi:hypothetical protein